MVRKQMVRNNVKFKPCVAAALICTILFYISLKIVEVTNESTIIERKDVISLDSDDHLSCSERQKEAAYRISNYCQTISKDRKEVSNILLIDFEILDA